MNGRGGGSDRTTRAFWRQPREGGSINRLVFTRDAPLGLVPIGGGSTARPHFAVVIEGDAAAEQAIVEFLGRDRIRGRIAEAVCDFIEEVAKVLAEYGEAQYELVATADVAPVEGDTESRRAPRHLGLVPPRSLHAVGPLVVQVVPRDNAKTPQFIRVPGNKILTIRLPRSLGTPRAHRRMLRRLDNVERSSRRFVTMTEPTAIPKGYDHDASQRASESAVVRLTRRWGVLPFLEPKNMTGYFVIAGAVCHRRAQAILRDHIVETLNALLRIEGLAEIRLEGLPSVKDIEHTLMELAAGRIDLKQASESTRI
jgi:hypothetical protein